MSRDNPLGQTDEPSLLKQKPRTVYCAKLFFLNMNVPFDGTPSQLITARSKDQDFDCVIRGAWSDLTFPRVKFVSEDTGIDWSQLAVPMLGWVGNSDKADPVRYWRDPYLIRARDVVRGDFRNSPAGEPAGQVVFLTHILNADLPYYVEYAQEYRLFVDLSLTKLQTTTASLPYDLLIWGAQCHVADATITATVIDDRTGWPWMSEPLPVLSFAGLDTQIQPRVTYPRPYLLRRNNKLRIQFSAAVVGNYLELICERVAKGHLMS